MVQDAKHLSDPQELEKIFESYLTDKSIKKITQRKTGEIWKEKIHKKEEIHMGDKLMKICPMLLIIK